MKNLAETIGKVAAIAYFILIMIPAIFFLLISPIMLISDINGIRNSGFSTAIDPTMYIWLISLFVAPSLLIRPLRKMYYKLPWLFPFVKIFIINIAILTVALMIINHGYQVQNEQRHMIFFILMLSSIVLGRLLMSIYFHWKKIDYVGGS